MPIELKILALGALLLFVHIFTATRFKTAQWGRKWNVGARDEALTEPNPVTGRTMRAQANFQETFPIAIIGETAVNVTPWIRGNFTPTFQKPTDCIIEAMPHVNRSALMSATVCSCESPIAFDNRIGTITAPA